MTTNGIEMIFLQTHNWGKAAKFFQSLGYELEFDTGHNSGQLRNTTGPAIFIAEVPETQKPGIQAVFGVSNPGDLQVGSGIEVVSAPENTHYGTREMVVRDPDGRLWTLSSPLKSE
ncbi:VOC family protein [Nocardia sp. NEAU-G5]|uniref:VOC family protein n=1 Tax=Nocardia albiluteola TaxID=2842303 RepID=A0ABS6BFK8_9NOCA|nr:VOC family protein [Nocardia albiluteola]MBU3068038.1 VOC family protein [Nocardia albiluteola]